MKFKKTMKIKKMDSKWYARFLKLANFQDYEYLVGDKKQLAKQREKFLSGKIKNPVMEYPKLIKINFKQKKQSLTKLKEDISKQETNDLIKEIYIRKIEEKIIELKMLESSKSKNDYAFLKYSKSLYGKPKKIIYEYTLNQARNIINKKNFSNDTKIKKAIKRLKKNIGYLKNKRNTNKSVSKIYHMPKFKNLDKEHFCSAKKIKEAFEIALKKYNILGWKVVIDKKNESKAISVCQEQKKINIPKKRRLKKTCLQGIIEHEVGTHIVRRENGEATKFKLLGLGLDKSLMGEEGVATYKQQLIEGANNFSGFDEYFAISLALGMDGKKRTFREVFEILKDYFLINSKKEGGEAIKFAENNAWDRCIRTFRGTSCQTSGTCFTRDIAYREGNIRIWDVVKNNPKEIKRFPVGKYDPANSYHIQILEQLNITEKDLTLLKK